MKSCIHCGNNPINHQTFWLYTSTDILLKPVRDVLFENALVKKTESLLASTIKPQYFFKPARALGLISYNTDIKKIPYPRAKVLWEEALTRGIDITEIKLFGSSIDLYWAKIENKNLVFMGLPKPKNFDASTLDWIDDKLILKQKLAGHGLPFPSGRVATSKSKALEIFNSLSKPVVVKPRRGSRGRHTTTFVYNSEQLKQAFYCAKQLCHWVIIEEQLFGDVYRGTVVGGKLLGVLGGSPPRVSGDDVHTVTELIAIKNKVRDPRVKEVIVNENLVNFLIRQHLSLDTILAKDQTIDLSEKIGINYGGTSYDITAQTHPETKAMFEQAAKVINNPILGFDLIIPSITKSYKQQTCGIIEANGAPFINLHHDPLIGQPINVAKYVWDLIS